MVRYDLDRLLKDQIIKIKAMQQKELLTRISINPNICFGKLRLLGLA